MVLDLRICRVLAESPSVTGPVRLAEGQAHDGQGRTIPGLPRGLSDPQEFVKECPSAPISKENLQQFQIALLRNVD